MDGLWSRLRVARQQLKRASHGAGPTLRLSLMAEIVCDLDLEKARGRVALPLAGGVVCCAGLSGTRDGSQSPQV